MAQGNAAGALAGAGKFTELRQRLLFVLGALIVYRIGCFIPVPGVNPDAMLAMMQAQGGGIVDMFNMFSGGALHRFSIFALNVMPYISASIVMQLGVHIFPSLKALQKEGESGRRKITQYSRIGAVLLAVVQGGSIATALQNQVAPGGMPVVYAPSSRRCGRVQASRSVAVARSPMTAWAMLASAVSLAVIHGSSLTQRMPLPSIANVGHPSARRAFAASPVRHDVRTG